MISFLFGQFGLLEVSQFFSFLYLKRSCKQVFGFINAVWVHVSVRPFLLLYIWDVVHVVSDAADLCCEWSHESFHCAQNLFLVLY